MIVVDTLIALFYIMNKGGIIVPNQYNKCDKENIIRQLMEVQAQVTVTPLINHGNPKVYCVNSCISPNYEYNNCNYCDCSYPDFYNSTCCYKGCDYNTTCESSSSQCKYNYTLTQVICIEIPICIDAEVDIREGIACCGKPDIIPTGCISNTKRAYMQII